VRERPGAQEPGRLQPNAHLLPLYQGQSPPQLALIRSRHAEGFLLPTDIRAIVIPALVRHFLGSDMAATFQKAGVLNFVFPGASAPKLPPQFRRSIMAS